MLLASGLPDAASENVLVQTKSGQPDAAALRTAVSQVVAAVGQTHLVANLHSPLDPDGQQYVSHDGHSMLVTFDMTGAADTAVSRVQPLLDAVAGVARANPTLRIEEVGDASSEKAFNATIGKDFKRAELFSIPLTLGILLAVFGALVAAVVPIGLALTAFIAAGGLLALTSRAVHIDGTATSVMLLVGLAVGVDYTLFYLKREREERALGRSPGEALRIAAATSGRSILVSGLTVVAAVGGLFLTGNATFKGVAEATVLVVAIAVLGSVTVLPALDVVARRPHREGPARRWRAIRLAPAIWREPRMARGASVRPAPARALGSRRVRRSGGARAAAGRHEDGVARQHRPAEDVAVRAGLRPVVDGVSRVDRSRPTWWSRRTT